MEEWMVKYFTFTPEERRILLQERKCHVDDFKEDMFKYSIGDVKGPMQQVPQHT
jgi:hypothetical protein